MTNPNFLIRSLPVWYNGKKHLALDVELSSPSQTVETVDSHTGKPDGFCCIAVRPTGKMKIQFSRLSESFHCGQKLRFMNSWWQITVVEQYTGWTIHHYCILEFIQLSPQPKLMKIVIFQSKKNRQYYFKVVAKNGKIIAQSEGYKRHRSAEKTAATLINGMATALVVGRAKKKPKISEYIEEAYIGDTGWGDES